MFLLVYVLATGQVELTMSTRAACEAAERLVEEHHQVDARCVPVHPLME